MKTTFLSIFMLLTCACACPQSKWMFENYNYIKQPGAAAFVPMLHFETKNNWYGELRYNYEDVRTISLFGGRTISGGKSVSYTLTPMFGVSAGQFTGLTSALNIDVEWRDFYVSVESQYSKTLKKDQADFFFNWSELGYSISEHVFTGLAVQYTREQDATYTEPGVFAGFSFGNVSIPFYAFSPFRSDRYFVLGVNVEYNLRKKKNKKSTL
jgi:hypothetical protein